MDDLISRQAVLNTLDFTDKFLDETRTVESYKTLLEECYKNLPSVTPTQKWIPVTEDTPPKGTICLWCNKQGSVFASEITYRSECSSYVGKHGYFSNGLENYGDIVAWMPLPEPYKEEREG